MAMTHNAFWLNITQWNAQLEYIFLEKLIYSMYSIYLGSIGSLSKDDLSGMLKKNTKNKAAIVHLK